MKKNILRLGLLVILTLLLITCLKKSKIEEFPTALEQFNNAAQFHQMHSAKILQKDNTQIIKEIIQHYMRVVDKFPDDDTYTPEAKLQIANGYYLIKNYKKAIQYYNSILKGSSKIEYHYARALKGIGDCYGIMGEKDLAVKYWTECVNKYKDSDNKTIIKLVDECKKNLGMSM